MSSAAVAYVATLSPLTLLAGAVALGLVVAVALYPDRPLGVWPAPPGVRVVKGCYPIVGHWQLIYRTMTRQVTDGLHNQLALQREYGAGGQPYSLCIPVALGGRTVMISRPEYIQWVQGSQSAVNNYIKGKPFRDCLSDVLSYHGIFVADGEVWRKQRKLASRIVS